MKVTTRVSAITILPEGKPIYDEMATTVRVEDDAAGPFLMIEQCRDDKSGTQQISICFSEIDALYQVMTRLRHEWEPSK